MSLLPSGTWNWDATPYLSEFSDITWVGHGGGSCTTPVQTAAVAFERDTTIKRSGVASMHLNSPSNAFYSGDCSRRAVMLMASPATKATEGSETWYTYSLRFPSDGTFPTQVGWATCFEWSTYFVTHPNFGMMTLDLVGGKVSMIFHTGFTAAGDPVADYNVTEELVGGVGLPARTTDKWHDFIFHVIYGTNPNPATGLAYASRPSGTTGVIEVYHRVEASPETGFTKIYSNKNDGSATVNRAPHPTMMWNTAYGAPGENGSPGISYVNIGLYRDDANGAARLRFDTLTRQESLVGAIAQFPAAATTATSAVGESSRLKVIV